jgi:hypothetical protein
MYITEKPCCRRNNAGVGNIFDSILSTVGTAAAGLYTGANQIVTAGNSLNQITGSNILPQVEKPATDKSASSSGGSANNTATQNHAQEGFNWNYVLIPSAIVAAGILIYFMVK